MRSACPCRRISNLVSGTIACDGCACVDRPAAVRRGAAGRSAPAPARRRRSRPARAGARRAGIRRSRCGRRALRPRHARLDRRGRLRRGGRRSACARARRRADARHPLRAAGSRYLFVHYDDGVQLELLARHVSEAKGRQPREVVLLDRDGLSGTRSSRRRRGSWTSGRHGRGWRCTTWTSTCAVGRRGKR
jgi:hypothetical protein